MVAQGPDTACATCNLVNLVKISSDLDLNPSLGFYFILFIRRMISFAFLGSQLSYPFVKFYRKVHS